MNLQSLKSRIPDYARDLRLNLSSVLTPEGAAGLEPASIQGIALACALATRNTLLVSELEAAFGESLDAERRRAARAAAAIMGMNNVYYRFLHLSSNDDYRTMPARLRMNVIANPGIDKAEFEIYCLAVSAINGCGLCIDSHEKALRKAEVGSEAIHSAVRIASVIHAVSGVMDAPAAAA